ncbi:MAG: histidinol dehydrogenase [Spirochaetes bacterium]|nr:histidinol dehydrogenase [Spirochaetota bacterium]
MKLLKFTDSSFKQQLSDIFQQEEQRDHTVESVVLDIEQNIRKRGFAALADYSKKFDQYQLTQDNFRVTQTEIDQLAAKISPQLDEALQTAIERIKNFHQLQKQQDFTHTDLEGNQMGQKVLPLDSVAIYVPGGRALYPSSIYMSAVPAQIAGVKRIVLLSPPNTFENSPEVARLIQLLQIDEVYRVGGAQAIFAAVYGVKGFSPVDKIVGPGNAYVAKAKQVAYGKVDIDMIAGPSEILVIADTHDQKDIPVIAADLLSQAEHDPVARPLVVGYDENYLKEIRASLIEQANQLPDNLKNNALSSINHCGLMIQCPSQKECIEVANLLAAEHLEIYSDDPYPVLEQIRHAGSVFIGKYTPESVGDYLGGPNHVLPTSGTARFSSPLGVYDFQKRISWIEFQKNSLEKYQNSITSLARSERLEAHAKSVESRFKKP